MMQFKACPEGHFVSLSLGAGDSADLGQDLTSPCSINFLRAIVPSSLVFIHLLTHLPRSRVFKRLTAPLAPIWTDPNSLAALTPASEKQEIAERDSKPQTYRGTERWRLATFVAAAGLMSVVWSSVLGMAVWGVVEGGEVWEVWTTGLTLFSWVSLPFDCG